MNKVFFIFVFVIFPFKLMFSQQNTKVDEPLNQSDTLSTVYYGVSDLDTLPYLSQCLFNKKSEQLNCIAQVLSQGVIRNIHSRTIEFNANKGERLTTQLMFSINEHGEIQDVKTNGGPPYYQEEIVKTFDRWYKKYKEKKYKIIPAKKDGKNVGAKFRVPIVYINNSY